MTGLIPTLSIDYKNHRQVFVESPTDAFYYQTIYNKHNQSKKRTHELYFITNAVGKGNSDLVLNTTMQLRKSGITTAFGIIDWDSINEDKEFIFVHGMNERYSIENFVLDPIYIICLLLSTNKNKVEKENNIQKALGLDSTYVESSIGNESEDFIQSKINWFFETYESKFISFNSMSNKKQVQVKYLNNKILQLPEWYVYAQGHKLLDKMKEVFPELASSKYSNEGELQKALTIIMARCYPFVPTTTIEVLERLSGVLE